MYAHEVRRNRYLRTFQQNMNIMLDHLTCLSTRKHKMLNTRLLIVNLTRMDIQYFIVLTPEGKLFKVKPKGTDAERKAMIVNFESQYLNQWYKIEYEMLSKDKIPLKPVGIGLRECDSLGEPKV